MLADGSHLVSEAAAYAGAHRKLTVSAAGAAIKVVFREAKGIF